MGIAYNNSIITDGLVLCLDAMNQRSYPQAGSSWFDLSRRRNHASLVNSPSFSNGLLTFDGTNQYASCAHPTGSSFGITYEVFVKLNETTDNSILSFNNATYVSGLSIIANRFIMYLSGSNYKYIFYGNLVQTGVWYHLVAYVGSSDAKDIKAYVNGVLDTATTPHTGVAYSPTTLYIATSNLTSYWLNCNIATVRCYNRELTASEVRKNYLATRERFTIGSGGGGGGTGGGIG